MRVLGVAVGLAAALIAGSAFAGDAKVREASTGSEERVLYVCDRSPATQRAFERKFGAVEFVTAREAMNAGRRGEVWAAPRCISDKEFQKLVAIVSERSQTIRLSSR